MTSHVMHARANLPTQIYLQLVAFVLAYMCGTQDGLRSKRKEILMHKKIGFILFAIILILLPVLTLINLPDEKKPFSENENRYLAEFPELSVETIKDESFMTGFDSWFSDRFCGRETWISAMNNTESLLGKTEISTVYTKNDQMLQILSEYDDIGAAYDEDKIHANIEIINNFAEKYDDIPVYFMLCPTSAGIYGDELLPKAVLDVTVDEKEMISACYNALSNVTPINVYDALYEAKDSYIFYRTDHHWTSLGAFTAYNAAGTTLGYTPYSLSDFSVETVSTDFQGTLFSKTLDQSVTKDAIDFYTLADGSVSTALTTSNGVTETSHDSIFFTEYLDVKDKYSAYTGQNAAVVKAASTHASNDTNANASKSILIIKDSYANSMVQFFVNNYDTVTMIDMRYSNMPLENLINVEDYDQVLFLYNCITFADDSDLLKLGF